MNEQTPRAERLHIAFYGRRNSGKSSLINALTGQQSAVVSATPGTTTDPVLKTMEIHGLGPCVLIDTPGFDDEGDLGALRVQQSRKMLDKTDLAVLLLTGAVPQNDEIEWFRLLEARHIPIVVVRSKADLFTGMSDAEAEALFGQRPLRVSASDRTGLDALREALIRNLPEDYNQPEITGSLASTGDVVMLVMPQDIQAPKGRLILPQVQTIRELLDKKCRVVCCTTDRRHALVAGRTAETDYHRLAGFLDCLCAEARRKPANFVLGALRPLQGRHRLLRGERGSHRAAPRRLPRADRRSLHARSGGRRHRPGQNSGDAPQTDRTRTAGRCGCRHGLSRRRSDNWTAHSLSKTETIPANTISPPTGNTSYTVRAGTWPKCRS